MLVGVYVLTCVNPPASPSITPHFRVFPCSKSDLKKKVLNFLKVLYT